MSAHTADELKQLQALPLYLKVRLTKQRIREWISQYGEDGVYISFSGGKDSTVLLDIVRQDHPDVLAIFCNTGLEFPEIVTFVRSVPNVRIVRPEKNFRQVIEEYGYPIISKPIAKRVHEYRNAVAKGKDVEKTSAYQEFNGLATFWSNKEQAYVKSFYNKEKWKFLLDAPFRISHKCCDFLKKDSFNTVEDMYPITAQMASESITRKKVWLAGGCNLYDADHPKSNPMSFWTEQDVLQYINENQLPIASVYGDIVEDPDGKLRTTGRDRTGCMFCLFGCHLERESRFEQIREGYPAIYDWMMKPWDEGGLGYKEVIDWLNENGNLHIRY